MMLNVLAWAALAAVCVRADPVDSFYPDLTDPSAITKPTYETMMQGAKRETRNETSDGSYAYCSMPHPDVSFYEEPGPVKNQSVKANLTNLLYIQRHQKRTAYHIFPEGENDVYLCSNLRTYTYAGPSDPEEIDPMPMYTQTYVDPQNPLNKRFTNSSCQFPQLTLGGYLDGVQHGQDLRKLYMDKYHVIPGVPDEKHMWMRSSTAALTQDSAGGVLRGLWTNFRGDMPVPLYVQADSIDTHEPSCKRADWLKSEAQKSDAWKKHMDETSSLRKELESLLKTNTSDWQDDWDHYNDNFQARLCNGYELPCSNNGPDKCVTKEQAQQVFAAGDWEYNYMWVSRENVKEAIQLTSGLYIQDLIGQLHEMKDENSELQYVHHFMHDGDIGPLAGSLGIESLRWPGMASNIAIELWTTDDHQTFVRVLYSGHTIRSKHGNLDWMPFDDFIKLWSEYVPKNFVSQCNKTS